VWFGKPERCAAFNVVLAVLGTCALGDFIISITMVWNSVSCAEEETSLCSLFWLIISPFMKFLNGNKISLSLSHPVVGLQMLLGSETAKRMNWKTRHVLFIISGGIGVQKFSVICNGLKSLPISCLLNLSEKPSGKFRRQVSSSTPVSLLQINVRSYCDRYDYGTWGPWSDFVQLALRTPPSAPLHLQKRIGIPKEVTRSCGDIYVDCCQLCYLWHHNSRFRELLVWSQDSGKADKCSGLRSHRNACGC
jgi:hypothetical protein